MSSIRGPSRGRGVFRRGGRVGAGRGARGVRGFGRGRDESTSGLGHLGSIFRNLFSPGSSSVGSIGSESDTEMGNEDVERIARNFLGSEAGRFNEKVIQSNKRGGRRRVNAKLDLDLGANDEEEMRMRRAKEAYVDVS